MKAAIEAILFGDLLGLKKILREKPDLIHAQNEQGQTLLSIAIQEEQLNCVIFLYAQGADPLTPDNNDITPFQLGAASKNNKLRSFINQKARSFQPQEEQELMDLEEAALGSFKEEADEEIRSAKAKQLPPEPVKQSDLFHWLEEDMAEYHPLLAKPSSAKLVNLIHLLGLEPNDLIQSGVSLAELEKSLKEPVWNKLTAFLMSNPLFEKATLFPIMDREAIKSEHEVPHWRSLKAFWRTKLWPSAVSIPLQSERVLKKAFAVTGFFEGIEVFEQVWTALVCSLIGNDLYNYYQYPDERYGETLGNIFFAQSENEDYLASSMDKVTVWPILIGVPLLWGLIKAIRESRQAKALSAVKIQTLIDEMKHYKPSFWHDFGRWVFSSLTPELIPELLPTLLLFIFPLPKLKHALETSQHLMVWDGRITPQERYALFSSMRGLAFKTKKFSQLETLATLANVFEGIGLHDLPKLHQAGVEREALITAVRMKTEALQTLRYFASHYQLVQEEKKNAIKPLARFVYVNYLLWTLGQSQTRLLEPLFFAYRALKFYARVLFWKSIINGIQDMAEFYAAKQACEEAGKLWLYMEQVADYECTVCGDWPIFYNDIFSDESCWAAYLQQTRTLEEILQAVERLNFSNVIIADFTQQPYNGTWLKQILPKLQEKTSRLQALYFNGSAANFPEPPLVGAQALADFLPGSPVQTLSLAYNRNNILFNPIHSKDFVLIISGIANSNIQLLDVSNNQIDNIGIVALAKVLPFSKVQWLILSGNPIGIENSGLQALAQGLPQSSVQTLDLDGSLIVDVGVQALAQGLPQSSVQILNLGFNQIGDAGAQALAQGLPRSSVQTLYLFQNIIGDLGMQAFAQALPQSSVQNLNLGANQIGDAGAQALAQGLPQSSVQILNLYFNQIEAAGAQALAQMLPRSSVHALYLGNNRIRAAGAQALAQVLPHTSVQVLGLEDNQIGNAGAQALAQVLPQTSVLKLILDYNQIGDVGAQALAQGLPQSSLQTLCLNINQIGGMGAQALAQGLPHSSVQVLGLEDNQIGDIGAQALGQVLPYSSVQVLYLRENQIGDVGAQSLGQGLPHSSVQILVLTINQIGDVGAQALAQGLPKSSVQELRLDSNQIEGAGAQALAQVLPQSSVQILQLGINLIGDAGAQALAQELPKSSVQYLDLTFNGIGDQGAIAIANVLTTFQGYRHGVWIDELNRNEKMAIARAKSNTKLNGLGLMVNNITTIGAESICRVLPQTHIPVSGLNLDSNPIDACQVDITTCVISGGNKLQPLLSFKWLSHSVHLLQHTYGQLGAQFFKCLTDFTVYQDTSATFNVFSQEQLRPQSSDNRNIFEKAEILSASHNNTPFALPEACFNTPQTNLSHTLNTSWAWQNAPQQIALGAVVVEGLYRTAKWLSSYFTDKTAEPVKPIQYVEANSFNQFTQGITHQLDAMQFTLGRLLKSKSIPAKELDWAKWGIEDYRQELKQIVQRKEATAEELDELKQNVHYLKDELIQFKTHYRESQIFNTQATFLAENETAFYAQKNTTKLHYFC